ncbi:hypothetical protein OUZ56_015816 [Daphnia magna]|uniref:Uncharacterized protein n=1 Tax=Daphnia magna TaxID=35525 RepID=A0ABR0ANT9_9CRUS|nr:hypothetical protein OUZ56_015816 [Daphnia magna]
MNLFLVGQLSQDEEISMMISQVNFARPWDMSGNGNANCNNDNHLTSSKLGLAPLQTSRFRATGA